MKMTSQSSISAMELVIARTRRYWQAPLQSVHGTAWRSVHIVRADGGPDKFLEDVIFFISTLG